MSKIDKSYHNLLDKILQEGYTYEDPNRKGVNRLEIPSYTFRHDFKDGFPAITTKKLNYKSVVTELIWFLRGDTNIKYLVGNGCNIWNKDALNFHKKKYPADISLPTNEFIEQVKEGVSGDLGKVYGHYWRNYDGFDQIKDIVDKMINTPMSSEIIVTARNPNDKDSQALPCCHYGFQIVVRPLYLPDFGKLGLIYDYNNPIKYGFELHWKQRSCDLFLGIPYNIASYATLALILEKITGYKALAIQGDLKKVHLYDNSLDAVKEQLSRDVDKYDKCELEFSINALNGAEDVFEDISCLDNYLNMLDSSDFKLENYESYPHIKVEMLERDE